jgi:AcrR family transcriptional regulator
MARPRSITDARLLDAAGAVIGRRGPGFTLAEVAKEAGVAVGTVAQRFGSKHGLLVAMVTTAIASLGPGLREAAGASLGPRLQEAAAGACPGSGVREAAAGAEDPALAAVRALVSWYAPLGDPVSAPNHLAQLGSDLADERLRGLMGEFYTAMEAEVAALLAKADLPSGPPAAQAARILTAVADGTALHWSASPTGDFGTRLEADLLAVLDAWRPGIATPASKHPGIATPTSKGIS